MTRINLRVYSNPGHAEVYLRLNLKNGNTERATFKIDTGAQTTLLPESFLEGMEVSSPRKVWLERAGIPGASFEAIEADIHVQLEDEAGNRTRTLAIVAWFGGTLEFLAGYGGLLNRAILYLDTPNLTGYMEVAE